MFFKYMNDFHNYPVCVHVHTYTDRKCFSEDKCYLTSHFYCEHHELQEEMSNPRDPGET